MKLEINEHYLQLLQEFCQIIPELEFKIEDNGVGEKYFEADCGNYAISLEEDIDAVEYRYEPKIKWLLQRVTVHHSWENPPETTEKELLFSEHLHDIAKAIMKDYTEAHVDYVLNCMEEEAHAPPEDEHRLEEGPL